MYVVKLKLHNVTDLDRGLTILFSSSTSPSLLLDKVLIWDNGSSQPTRGAFGNTLVSKNTHVSDYRQTKVRYKVITDTTRIT